MLTHGAERSNLPIFGTQDDDGLAEEVDGEPIVRVRNAFGSPDREPFLHEDCFSFELERFRGRIQGRGQGHRCLDIGHRGF